MAERMLGLARRFLEAKRVALVGLSRDERDFGRGVFRELVRRGYDVVPVNPALTEAEGRRAFASVREVTPPVEAALVMTSASHAAEVARDCLAAGVTRIWFHRGAGPGAASAEAVALCRAQGVEPVTDLCPFMALPGSSWFHRLHGLFRGAARLEVRAEQPRLPA